MPLSIQLLGDKLDITVYEYVKDEERDAKELSGVLFRRELYINHHSWR